MVVWMALICALQTELPTKGGRGQLGDQGVALPGQGDDRAVQGLNPVGLGLAVTGVGEVQQLVGQ